MINYNNNQLIVIENIQRSKNGQHCLFQRWLVFAKLVQQTNIVHDILMVKVVQITSCPWTQRDGRLVFTSFSLCWGKEEGWGARRFLFPFPSHCAGKENKSVVWLLSAGTLDDAAVGETTWDAALGCMETSGSPGTARMKHSDIYRLFSPLFGHQDRPAVSSWRYFAKKTNLYPCRGKLEESQEFFQVCLSGPNFAPTLRKSAGNQTLSWIWLLMSRFGFGSSGRDVTVRQRAGAWTEREVTKLKAR